MPAFISKVKIILSVLLFIPMVCFADYPYACDRVDKWNGVIKRYEAGWLEAESLLDVKKERTFSCKIFVTLSSDLGVELSVSEYPQAQMLCTMAYDEYKKKSDVYIRYCTNKKLQRYILSIASGGYFEE